MTTPKAKLITAEEILMLPDDGKYYELLDGELVELMPAGVGHGKMSAKTIHRLLTFVGAGDLGEVVSNDAGIILGRDPDRVRGPDVCFISRERLPAGGLPRGYLEIVPDFIIEVVSPSDRASEVEAKMEEWVRAGARLAWAMYPDTRSIDAAPVLPEFSLLVADLFR